MVVDGSGGPLRPGPIQPHEGGKGQGRQDHALGSGAWAEAAWPVPESEPMIAGLVTLGPLALSEQLSVKLSPAGARLNVTWQYASRGQPPCHAAR